VKEDEMGRACSTNLEKRNACRILMAKPEGKRPLGRARRRWINNFKMGLTAIGWGGMDWTYLAQDRDQWRAFVIVIMNVWVPQKIGKFMSGRMTGSFSTRAWLHGVIYSGR
jgi:hypothetical protein